MKTIPKNVKNSLRPQQFSKQRGKTAKSNVCRNNTRLIRFSRKPDYLGLLPEVGYKFLEDMLDIWKEYDNVPKRYRQTHEEVSRFHLELMLHLVFSYGFDRLMERFEEIDEYVHEIELDLCQRDATQVS